MSRVNPWVSVCVSCRARCLSKKLVSLDPPAPLRAPLVHVSSVDCAVAGACAFGVRFPLSPRVACRVASCPVSRPAESVSHRRQSSCQLELQALNFPSGRRYSTALATAVTPHPQRPTLNAYIIYNENVNETRSPAGG